MKIDRVIIIVLDSLGVGELPDAHKYGDEGSNTLKNLAVAVGGVNLPNLQKLGIGNIIEIMGVDKQKSPSGAYGKMAEKSPGKDTTTGHWEIAGQILEQPFPTYPNGFPDDLINEFVKRINKGILGNIALSGTEIIAKLGKEHMETGKPIVYTSADSVFQIAAHEKIIPLNTLYDYCKIARKLLQPPHGVGRVIARPFIGEPGKFERTANRKDFSLEPPYPTILDTLVKNNYDVIGIGKIKDIYAGRGVTKSILTEDNNDGVSKTIKEIQKESKGLIFTNLVEFDMKHGHRNDARGYAEALEEFDKRVPEIINALNKNDLLIITADHGCDPTTPGTDHTREYVPLLICGDKVLPGVSLGTRETFADIAATIANIFRVDRPSVGNDMSKLIFSKS